MKYLIFQIKEQATSCPMGGRMLTYHTQITINITRLLLHNCDYFVTDMLVNICLIPDLNSFRLPTLIYFL